MWRIFSASKLRFNSGEFSTTRRDFFQVCLQRKTEKTGKIFPYNDQ